MIQWTNNQPIVIKLFELGTQPTNQLIVLVSKAQLVSYQGKQSPAYFVCMKNEGSDYVSAVKNYVSYGQFTSAYGSICSPSSSFIVIE